MAAWEPACIRRGLHGWAAAGHKSNEILGGKPCDSLLGLLFAGDAALALPGGFICVQPSTARFRRQRRIRGPISCSKPDARSAATRRTQQSCPPSDEPPPNRARGATLLLDRVALRVTAERTGRPAEGRIRHPTRQKLVLRDMMMRECSLQLVHRRATPSGQGARFYIKFCLVQKKRDNSAWSRRREITVPGPEEER